MCKLDSPCPYGKHCKDCLHYAPSNRGRKYQKTGIPTNDMKSYKREYTRRQQAQQLELEMKCARVS